MDDVRWQTIPEDWRPEAEDRLLQHLGRTRAFLFAIGQNVDNPHGAAILKRCSAAGHRIGNHTYSHQRLFGKISPDEFEADVLRDEDVLRNYSGFRSFLSQHGYRNGAVSGVGRLLATCGGLGLGTQSADLSAAGCFGESHS
jgi:peptidoglycan/xylan/chitin deacetylase (PgdA/CDA1 family)